jgi:hypothetical protein
VSAKSKVVVLSVVSFLAVVLGLLWYRHFGKPAARPIQSAQQTSSPASQGAAAVDRSNLVELSHVKSPMAAAFDSGALPQPLAIPSGDLDQAAIALAKQVAARDEASTSALMTALQMSGLSIRAKDGTFLLQPATRGQGMVLDEWEVAAMAKLYGGDAGMTLADLGAALSKIIPDNGKPSTAKMLTQAIAQAANGRQPLRFWARFIAELGHQHSAESYDLVNGDKVQAEAVKLDAIQLSLILLRLSGELSTIKAGPARPGKSAGLNERPVRPAPILRDAVFHPGVRARLLRVAESTSGPRQPCYLDDSAAAVLDASALADELLLSSVIARIQEGLGGLEKLNQARGLANLVLILAKLIWTYSALDVQVTMDNAPLERTQGTNPGQSRMLNAHVSYDINTWQILNCLRPLLNITTHLDLGNLPNHGDADGAGVEWELLEGGTNHKTGGFNYVPSWDTANYLAIDKQAYVMFDNGSGSQGETWSTVADAHGNATMRVTGRPQPVDLTGRRTFPWMRPMSVYVKIKVKVGDKGSKLLGEFLDVLRPALSVAGTDPLGQLSGLIDAVAETLYRMHWYASDTYSFQVKDWKLANGSWFGDLKISDTRPPETSEFQNADGGRKDTSTYKYEVSIAVNGGDPSGASLDGFGQVAYARTNTSYFHHREWVNCVNAHSGRWAQVTGHGESREELHGGGAVTVNVQINDSTGMAGAVDNQLAAGDAPPEVREKIKQMMQAETAGTSTYSISVVKAPKLVGTWSTSSTETKDGFCADNGPKTRSDGGPRENLSGIGFDVAGQQFDPKHPDVLEGSITKGTVTISWKLKR